MSRFIARLKNQTGPRLLLLVVASVIASLILASCAEESSSSTPASEDQGPLPVIFIPGVQGSSLLTAEGDRILWPPGGLKAEVLTQIPTIRDNFFRLSLNPETEPHEAIYAQDVIRQWGTDQFYDPFLGFLAEKGGYVEYDVDLPKERTLAGAFRSQKPKPSLFVFAYDWRLPIEENARILTEYVAVVDLYYPGKKVNIVAHSMGGLVARRYIIDNPNKVNKLITIATPFLGAAKPLFQMIYGKLAAPASYADAAWQGVQDVIVGGTTNPFAEGPTREMLLYFPGVHELLLSESFYALGGPPYTVVTGIAPLHSKRGLSIEELMGSKGKVDQLFPKPARVGKTLKTPASTNRDFHAYTANGNNQDDWSRDKPGVQYYHIVGVQYSGDTLLSLNEALPGTRYPQLRIYAEDLRGPGDGTVPLLSAARIGNGRNLNAPNARLFVYVGGSIQGQTLRGADLTGYEGLSRNPMVTFYPSYSIDPTTQDIQLEHTGIMTNPAVIAKVLELLGQKKDEPTAPPSLTATPAATLTRLPTVTSTPARTPTPTLTSRPTPTTNPTPTRALTPTRASTSTPTAFKYVLKQVRVNPSNASLDAPPPEPRAAGSFRRATVSENVLAWQVKSVWDGQVVSDYTFTFNIGTAPKELLAGKPVTFTAQGRVSGTQSAGFPLGEFFFQFGQRGETMGIGLYPYNPSLPKSGSATASYVLSAQQSAPTITLSAFARPCPNACVIEWIYERQSL